jgi:hypothetical protein
VALLTLTLLLSGCGGAKKNGSSTTDTTATSGGSTTTIDPAVLAADRAFAQQVVLVQSDVPAGWTASTPTPETTAEAAAADLSNGCVGLPKNSEVQVSKVDGNDFKNGNNVIRSEVRSLKTAKLVQQDVAGFSNSKNFTCIANVIDAQFSNEVQDARSSSTVAKLNDVTSGDSQFALRVTTLVTANGGTTTVYSDILGMTNGRFEVTVNVIYIGVPAPASFDKTLLGAVSRHMASAR